MISGPRTQRGRPDSGLATVELVLVVAVPVLMLAFLVLCGRITESRLRVEDAAHQAARAASTARSADAAKDRARTTAAALLGEGGVGCRSVGVEVEGAVQPGETVTAVITCRVELSDLAVLRVPGTAIIRESFAAPIDVYRGALSPAAKGAMW
ncbi:TadE/TadG family type IV pilus assembly protein [Streptomyces sp. NPDC001663]|uniref:TadE/TadG family type IV pilus assembly protein n=1 Tax=Streptomyces sp. NPDC001663 TaxID=3364597 RepID=UPI0036BCD728